MTEETKRRKMQKPQLKVVFETNILFTGTASDLVQHEAATLIRESVFPDLEIQWYLPEMVRHERQYQMQKRALELVPAIAKVERLLGHNLAITEQLLLESVEKAVSQRKSELGLLDLALDNTRVDWNRVALDAAYRRPPFQDGEKEKGFRDRMIVECFLQLVADSPKKADHCRIVLLTGDKLVTEAVNAKTGESTNTNVLASLEELKGLINTLVSRVDEAFLATIKPRADKLFFISKDQSTIFYKERIRDRINEKFASELDAPPPGATSRTNGTWRVSSPNFVKKNGRRIQWVSRISIEAEASKVIPQVSALGTSTGESTHALDAWVSGGIASIPLNSNLLFQPNKGLGPITSYLPKPGSTGEWSNILAGAGTGNSVTTHKGTDIYEVFWSVDVNTSRDLRRPSIDDLRHQEPMWEQVT